MRRPPLICILLRVKPLRPLGLEVILIQRCLRLRRIAILATVVDDRLRVLTGVDDVVDGLQARLRAVELLRHEPRDTLHVDGDVHERRRAVHRRRAVALPIQHVPARAAKQLVDLVIRQLAGPKHRGRKRASLPARESLPHADAQEPRERERAVTQAVLPHQTRHYVARLVVAARHRARNLLAVVVVVRQRLLDSVQHHHHGTGAHLEDEATHHRVRRLPIHRGGEHARPVAQQLATRQHVGHVAQEIALSPLRLLGVGDSSDDFFNALVHLTDLLDVDELVVARADVVGRVQVVDVVRCDLRPDAAAVDLLGRGSHGQDALDAVERVDALDLRPDLRRSDVAVELVVVREHADLLAVDGVHRADEVHPIIEADLVGAADDDAREVGHRGHELALERVQRLCVLELAIVLAGKHDHAALAVGLLQRGEAGDELLIGEERVHGVDHVDAALGRLVIHDTRPDRADTRERLALLAALDAQRELLHAVRLRHLLRW